MYDLQPSESDIGSIDVKAIIRGLDSVDCYQPLFLFNQFGDCDESEARTRS